MVSHSTMTSSSVRNALPSLLAARQKVILARDNFDGLHVWHNSRPLPQDAQKDLPARPQPKNRPQAYPSSPAHPELPRQLVSRVGYVEDLFKARTKLGGFFSILLVLALAGCASSPYERGGNPQGLSQRDVERDYMECEYKARFANPQQFYNQGSPFPFSAGSQSPADHARALHGLSTINAMRDTCLAAKGYRVE
jgi:hypothetical protein